MENAKEHENPRQRDARPIRDWEAEAEAFTEKTQALQRWLRSHSNGHPWVAVFGSAREKRILNFFFSRLVYVLAAEIVVQKFSLLTGGCQGLVAKLQEYFCNMRDMNEQISLGIRIKVDGLIEPPNAYLDYIAFANDFGKRLVLMMMVDGVIVLPGGIGTLLELFFFLQHSQATDHKVPICVVPGWWWAWWLKPLLWFLAFFKVIDPGQGELGHLYFCNSAEKAVEIIRQHVEIKQRLAQPEQPLKAAVG